MAQPFRPHISSLIALLAMGLLSVAFAWGAIGLAVYGFAPAPTAFDWVGAVLLVLPLVAALTGGAVGLTAARRHSRGGAVGLGLNGLIVAAYAATFAIAAG